MSVVWKIILLNLFISWTQCLTSKSEKRTIVPLRYRTSMSSCSFSRQSDACPASVPMSQFLPHGPEAGDITLPPGDDESSGPIPLSINFPFMEHRESILYVNINGLISFCTPIDEFKPKCNQLPRSQRMVAPFWSDVITFTGTGGNIYYRQTTDPELLKRVRFLFISISESTPFCSKSFN